ncbi:MAG: ribosome maturation factor RimP [bacterium]|nr:ribosome maturation factor RimP [bacterium]
MQPSLESLYSGFLPVLTPLDLELVDVEWAPGRGGGRLVVIIYKRNGFVSSDECSRVSFILGEYLDNCGLLSSAYVLEVSSPGLDRILKRENEYNIFAGKNIAIRLSETISGRNEVQGILQGIRGAVVEVQVGAEILSVPMGLIKKAQLVYKDR